MTATDELDDFYADSVIVETKTGNAGIGPIYAAAQTIDGLLVDGNRLVANANGAQETSTAQFTTRPENGPAFAPGSRVTIGARVSYVITATTSSAGALDLPAHCRVALT